MKTATFALTETLRTGLIGQNVEGELWGVVHASQPETVVDRVRLWFRRKVGRWERHWIYGRIFTVDDFTRSTPTLDEMRWSKEKKGARRR